MHYDKKAKIWKKSEEKIFLDERTSKKELYERIFKILMIVIRGSFYENNGFMT